MEKLPDHVKPYKRTSIFNEKTTPKGLLKSHSTKIGTWGKICVTRGKLLYVIETNPPEKIELTPDFSGVVEPQTLHHVELIESVEFLVEFYK